MKHTFCPHCGEAVQAAALVHTRTTANRKPVAKAGNSRNGRARMWQSMRSLPVFSVPEICATAEVERGAAFNYVSALLAHSFLRKVHVSRGETGDFSTYKLIKNPGPHYPRVRNDRSLFEPNRMEVLHAA